MSLPLITDRTSTDTSRRTTLRAKIKDRTATSAEWSEWLSPLKGAYNASDLNRVGEAVQYLADLLASFGYSVPVQPKTDWTIEDIPRAADMDTYLGDVRRIKEKFYGTTPLPATMNDLTAEGANNIERLLAELDVYIGRMTAGFRRCGTFKSGQGVILP